MATTNEVPPDRGLLRRVAGAPHLVRDGRWAVKRRRLNAEEMTADEVERFFGSLPRVVRQLRNGRRINLTIASFSAAAWLLSSVIWTQAQDDIRDAARQDRVSAFEQCQVANDNARALNSFLDAAIASVKGNDTLTKAEKDYRVSLYTSIKQRLPVCERP